jgi:hypothetical protein
MFGPYGSLRILHYSGFIITKLGTGYIPHYIMNKKLSIIIICILKKLI